MLYNTRIFSSNIGKHVLLFIVKESEIMKKFRNLFTVLFLLTGSLIFAAEKASVQTEITEIDVHGNAYLAVKAKQMVTRGFSASDIVNITAGNN